MRGRRRRCCAQTSLTATAWTDVALQPQQTWVRTIHILELRASLAEVFAARGRTSPAYTDPTLTAQATIVRAVHVTEIRNAILVVAGVCPPDGCNEVIEYYHVDAVGSVRAVTDETGAVILRRDYFPFGEGVGPDGGTSLGYTGQEGDPESGLNYVGARYYRAWTGRFTSADPIFSGVSNPQAWNRYAYALNSPLVYTDPTGLVPITCQVRDGKLACGPYWPDGSTPGGSGNAGGGSGGPGGGGGGGGAPRGPGGPGGDRRDPTEPRSPRAPGPGQPGPTEPDPTTPDSPPDADSPIRFEETVTVVAEAPPAIAVMKPSTTADGPDMFRYNTRCITDALTAGALNMGIDAIGLVPAAGGVARMLGHGAGYRGVVADQAGHRFVNALGKSTNISRGLNGLLDTSPAGVLSTFSTIGGFIPGVGQGFSILSIGLDIYRTGAAIRQCQ